MLLELLALGTGLLALGTALWAGQLAHSSSARTLKRKLDDALDEQDRRIKRLEHDAADVLERATKQHRRTAQARRRMEELLERSEAEPDSDADDGGFDADGGPEQGVLPLRGRVDPGPWLGGRTG